MYHNIKFFLSCFLFAIFEKFYIVASLPAIPISTLPNLNFYNTEHLHPSDFSSTPSLLWKYQDTVAQLYPAMQNPLTGFTFEDSEHIFVENSEAPGVHPSHGVLSGKNISQRDIYPQKRSNLRSRNASSLSASPTYFI